MTVKKLDMVAKLWWLQVHVSEPALINTIKTFLFVSAPCVKESDCVLVQKLQDTKDHQTRVLASILRCSTRLTFTFKLIEASYAPRGS